MKMTRITNHHIFLLEQYAAVYLPRPVAPPSALIVKREEFDLIEDALLRKIKE